MFLTCGFFGFVVSSISRILDQKESKKREFTNDLEIINRFMAKKEVSEGVRVEVNQYMENLYLQEQESQTQQVHHIIEKLSQRLKMDIAREANSRLLEKMSFFNSFTLECQKNVVYLFQEQRYSPNEIIYSQNDSEGLALYFIEKG